MEIKPQTVIKMKVIKKNGYCPIFNEGDEIIIKKHCLDVLENKLQKYCYATLNETNISRYVLDENRMFIFYWNEDGQKSKIKYLKGLDKDGKVIFEEKFTF